MKNFILILALLMIQKHAFAAIDMQCQLMGDCPYTSVSNQDTSDVDLLDHGEFASPLVENDMIRPLEAVSNGYTAQWSRPRYEIPLGLDGSDLITTSIAAVGGWSRVHDNAHWASDVVMGALIGHLVTKHLLRKDSSKSRLVLSPTYDMNGNLIMGVHIVGKRERERQENYLFDLD